MSLPIVRCYAIISVLPLSARLFKHSARMERFTMKLQIEWGRLIRLRDASEENMIYSLDLDRVTDKSGIFGMQRTASVWYLQEGL